MKRILFVDDEPSILDGLRRMLRTQRKEWEMAFAGSGQEALDASEEAPFDVVVSDMRMPGMDGAELLKRLHERHPKTVRFILSGHSEMEGVMRTVQVAHQFLSKPCDAERLKEAVSRSFELQGLLDDPQIQGLVGELESLPSTPETYSAIVQALSDPEVEMGAVTGILESDLAMSAKLLQLVNSAFFGLPQPISNVAQATSYLGLNTIRDLVLSVEVFQPPADAADTLKEFLGELQTRSTWTGTVARRMFDDEKQASLAFTAGMLHDVGLLIVATQLPDRLTEAMGKSEESGQPLHMVEEEIFGVSHAEIGAYLLGVWGLPYPILEAVAYHHRPTALTQESFSELTAVHVASALVCSRSVRADQEVSPYAQIDLSYLEGLGVRDRLEEWEAMVDEDAAKSSEEARG